MANNELGYRSVFVSDLHLGSGGCKTESIRHFLHDVECEYLYLVGDILDMWVAGKWKQAHTNVVRTVLGKSKGGCMIRYTPGNHDALLRKLNGCEFGNIAVDDSFVHVTADGKKLMVIHGDLFDRSVTGFKPLAWIGAWCYECLTVIDSWTLSLRQQRKTPARGLSSLAKQKLKSLIQYMTSFEERITVSAQRQGFDGVICGHIHKPRMEALPNGMLYINSGDWIEHCTAVVEHWDGRLELLSWADMIEQRALLDDRAITRNEGQPVRANG